MNHARFFRLLAIGLPFFSGCVNPPTSFVPDGRHRSNAVDAIFKRRPYDLNTHPHHDPVMGLARDLTVIEDDLRRDGTITVKQPDVWGDGNMMYFLQEFDKELQTRTKLFTETLQGYIARSDQAELQSSTGLAVALSGKRPAAGTGGASSSSSASSAAATPPTAAVPDKINLPDYAAFDLIAKAKAAGGTLSVEPTEMARQHATYIDVCQAIRRRHMGDDNTRAAGYGLYKFRVPVSVLPGRETNHGFAGIVTLRAQMEVDEAHLCYTYPKLVIADLINELVPLILRDWGNKDYVKNVKDDVTKVLEQLSKAKQTPEITALIKKFESIRDQLDATKHPYNDQVELLSDLECLKKDALSIVSGLPDHQTSPLQNPLKTLLSPKTFGPRMAIAAPPQIGPIALPNAPNIYGDTSLYVLRTIAEKQISVELEDAGKPKAQELRAFLFRYLSQIHGVLEQNRLYSDERKVIIAAAAADIAKGNYQSVTGHRCEWMCHASEVDSELRNVGWLLVIQAGILDQNLWKIVEGLEKEGKLPHDLCGLKNSGLYFFDLSDSAEFKEQRLQLWQTIIWEEFPLHVFTLDSQIEEQNIYDAFSRRREMQLALAYNVANGNFNLQQKLAFSRQLALDQAEIGLNRTVVGFSHGEDTFGWYFYPRVQSPPVEQTNIGALARTIWSTGPTEKYDLKNRKLEPGMRECEVLIAMPSFVTKVRFDVTANWESLAHPGVTKRSYEEMIAQGGRMQTLKTCLGNLGDNCYRPGDVERLVSRIDQLEQMLGMQTHKVNVPYSYEQSGTDLFDTGDINLRPVLTGYYGLEYLVAGATNTDAYLFLSGKNFHPSLTHVIIGGRESHSLVDPPGADVEVINRQLIRVRVTNINKDNSAKKGFQVRVGTPAGLSGPLSIPPQAPPPSSTPEGWSFAKAPASDKPASLTAQFNTTCTKKEDRFVWLATIDEKDKFVITHNFSTPFPPDMNGLFIAEIKAAKSDGTAIEFSKGDKSIFTKAKIPLQFVNKDPTHPSVATWSITKGAMLDAIREQILDNSPKIQNQPFTLTVSGYVTFDKFPVTKLLNELKIEVVPFDCCPKGDSKPAEPKPGDKPPPKADGGVDILPDPAPVVGGYEADPSADSIRILGPRREN